MWPSQGLLSKSHEIPKRPIAIAGYWQSNTSKHQDHGSKNRCRNQLRKIHNTARTQLQTHNPPYGPGFMITARGWGGMAPCILYDPLTNVRLIRLGGSRTGDWNTNGFKNSLAVFFSRIKTGIFCLILIHYMWWDAAQSGSETVFRVGRCLQMCLSYGGVINMQIKNVMITPTHIVNARSNNCDLCQWHWLNGQPNKPFIITTLGIWGGVAM